MHHDYSSWRSHLYTTAIGVALITLLICAMGIISVRMMLRSELEKSLQSFTTRIRNEISIQNGTWDMRAYNADPLTPHPNGSGGYVDPLYIITRDGFVVERNKPVYGLLDTSDYQAVSKGREPFTVTSVTGEQWRVLIAPIPGTQATAVVSFYNPDIAPAALDSKLHSNLTRIIEAFTPQRDVTHPVIDPRVVDYDTSFEVTNEYHRVLSTNGRNPIYVDPGYLEAFLENAQTFEYQAQIDKSNYYFVSSILRDDKGNPAGVVIAGKSLSEIDEAIMRFVPMGILAGLIIGVCTYLLMRSLSKKNTGHSPISQSAVNEQVRSLSYDPDSCTFTLNSARIIFPADSYQSDLLKYLFAQPHKQWTYEELASHAGNQDWTKRSIYDAILAIHRKTGRKIIESKSGFIALSQDLRSLLMNLQ